MSDFTGRAVTSVTVSHVIVRACVDCGHPREIGTPCAGCGLTAPPVVHDLGTQAYTHRNPLKRAAWSLIGQHLAARRAVEASRYVQDGG